MVRLLAGKIGAPKRVKMRTIINIFGWLFISGCLLSLGFLAGWYGRVRVKENIPEPLPTIAEIQQRIGCVKIDGKLGPETQELWDKEICNQFASQYFEEVKDE